MIIQKFKPDYKKATKSEKSLILNQLEELTSLDRKHLIKLLRRKSIRADSETLGRPKTYTEEMYKHISKLHSLMERISPKRMKEAIPLWLPFYEMHYGVLPEQIRVKLLNISSSTIGRILKSIKDNMKGKSTTKVDYKLKNLIPLKRLDEVVNSPGTIQADTVAHCGTSLSGKYISTLTVTDIYTGWTENRACWTKDSLQIKNAITDIEKSTPIIMKYFDTDCGTEFLNYRVMSHLENRQRPIKLRKARPYKKNDQCYVEQKNHTHVRNIFGYDRLESESLVAVMNRIYKKYWNPLHNYFLPTFKLEDKKRIGSKVHKKFEKPKTPASRLLDSKGYSGYMKNRVKHELTTLDPIELKLGLEKELKIFYKLLEYERNKLAA
tara:strand:- start:703 stop:1842 length:1140 start_codon:yes stop_codon:yes gene_type:complete